MWRCGRVLGGRGKGGCGHVELHEAHNMLKCYCLKFKSKLKLKDLCVWAGIVIGKSKQLPY